MNGRHCVNVEIEWLIKWYIAPALLQSYDNASHPKVQPSDQLVIYRQNPWTKSLSKNLTNGNSGARNMKMEFLKWKLWLTLPLLRDMEKWFFVFTHITHPLFYFFIKLFSSRTKSSYWNNSLKIFLIIHSQNYAWALAGSMNNSPKWKERKFDLISPISAKGQVRKWCPRISSALNTLQSTCSVFFARKHRNLSKISF